MKKQILLITLLTFTNYLLAQNFQWAKSIGVTGLDRGYSIKVDGSGNVLTTGYFSGTVDFNPDSAITFNLTSSGGYDVFISKTDAKGKFLWAKRIGGTKNESGNGIAVDGDGNVYITGYYYGTVDFDPDTATYNISPVGANDIFVLKLDKSGSFVWVKSIGGAYADMGEAIAVDVWGNVFISGYFSNIVDFDPGSKTYNMTSTAGSPDVFITRLDTSGNLVWAKRIGGASDDDVYSIAIDNSKNIYATGFFWGTVDFDPGSATFNLNSIGGTDISIFKLNADGNFVWAKSMGCKKDDLGLSICVDSNENVFTTGKFQDSVNFNAGAGTYNLYSAGTADIFISKIDKGGNLVWAKSTGGIDGDYPSSIALDDSGNIYISGNFWGKTDLSPGSGTYYLTSAGLYDIFILKLNPSGNFLWGISLGDFSNDYGKSIAIGPLGDVLVTGHYVGTIDFNPASGVYKLSSAGNNDDIFILKLISCTSAPSAAAAISGPSNACEGSSVSYSIKSVSGAKGYIWTIPSDARIIGGQNKNSITIMFGKISGNIKVTPINSCGAGKPDSLSVKINGLPSLTISPGSSTFCQGGSVSIKVSGANSYLWKPSKGLNDSTLATVTAKPDTTTTYIITGKNLQGCENTIVANITVNPIPKIKVQPLDNIINVGADAKFIISAFGTKVNYQWQQDSGTGFINLADGGKYSGVTNDTLTIKDVKLFQTNWKFRCITSNGNCSDTSNVAKLIVRCALNFTKQPVSKTLNVGSNAQFILTASSQTASYKWQQNKGSGFANIADGGQYSGATNDTLTITSVKYIQNNYKFRCIISEYGCSDTSNTVSMTINCTLNITSQPSNQTVNVGSKVLFVSSSSSISGNYQWLGDNGSGFVKLSNGGQYSGVTNDTFIINGVKFSQNNYKYKCIAEDGGCWDTSNTALLKVNCVSTITTQPGNQTVNVGTKVLFILSSSSSTATYQWQQNSGSGFTDLSNGGQYSGVTNDTLTINNVTLTQNNYLFRCKLSDQGCTDSSASALLTIKTIGIKNFTNQKNFSIYPNPTNNFITIESNQFSNNLPYSITDQTGRQILKGELNSKINPVDLSLLARGFYFLQIGEVDREVFKIVKQ